MLDQGHLSSIRFSGSVLGNIGAPLRHGLPEDSLDDEDADEVVDLDDGALATPPIDDVEVGASKDEDEVMTFSKNVERGGGVERSLVLDAEPIVCGEA